MAYKANPKGVFLISDTMMAMGVHSQKDYNLGRTPLKVQAGKATVGKTPVLAGSFMGLDAAVRFFYQHVGCSMVEALEAATLKPAQILGLEKRKGALLEGTDADLMCAE
jgi:N-acetylglucosamine-6-phosphate deacetylase